MNDTKVFPETVANDSLAKPTKNPGLVLLGGRLRPHPGVYEVQVPGKGLFHFDDRKRQWVNNDGRWIDKEAITNAIDRGAFFRGRETV